MEIKYPITVPAWSEATTTLCENEVIPFNSKNYLYVSPDLVKYIRQKLREFKILKNFSDHYLYFCSTIFYLLYVDKRHRNKSYAPINYKTMVSIISKFKYAEIVENLKDWHVIESNNSYSPGKGSIGYRLLHPFDSGVKKIPVRDKLINNKINRFKMKSYKELKKLPYPYSYLSVTNTWVELNYKKAHNYNISTYLISDPEVYNSNYYSISAYKDGDYRFSVDTSGYRAHTNMTNLKKDFRKFYSVDGEKLAQVDIRNSQPLFFYLHIKNLSGIPDDEKEKYRGLVESGKFYEFFMEKTGIPPEKREKAKKNILSALFFDKSRPEKSRYLIVMESEFPNIAAYINRMRSTDYTLLAYLLQRTESQFVIETVVGEFINRYGDGNEFISTIHDSIVVKEHLLETAESLVLECFEKEGIRPQLSKEIFL